MRITRTIIFRVHPLLRVTIFSIFLFSAGLSNGQFQDDFSDGDFHFNPSWAGDTADFSITNSSAVPPGQKPALKLDTDGIDTSFLVVESTLAMQAEWRFWAKMSFNTSASNYARIYLVSDQDDLTGELNGYFVQLGGANDSIGLYRQAGGSIDLLMQGMTAYTGNSTNVLRIKVTRDVLGEWQMHSDQEGGYNFIPEASCQDNTFMVSSYFGIYCRYTSSNATKFYFDDFYSDDMFADTIPPHVISVEVASATALEIAFSEDVEASSAADSLHYLVDGGIGYPVEVTHDPSDHSHVVLSFEDFFEENLPYTIEVKAVKDLSGNAMEAQSLGFVLSPPLPIEPAALVINEIMADVNPAPAGLPEADYLELYNTTSLTLNLLGASIKPRESAETLYFPDITMEPGGFLIVTNASDALDFEDYGQVIGFNGFSLNNEGIVVLRNKQGHLIHSVGYDKSYYRDETKADGGWALEMIDPDNPCSLSKTWKSSESAEGGTPGSMNSVSGVINSLPEIMAVDLTDPYTLRITFSHHMDSLSVISCSSYHAGESHGSPFMAAINEILFNEVELMFDLPFPENDTYTLELSDTLKDCCGLAIPPGETYFFIHPGMAGTWDIVINEIMADPDPPAGLPGHEYIEIFNTTDRYIGLNGWTVAAGSTEYTLPEMVIHPGEYLLLVGSEEALIFSVFARTFLVEGLILPNSGGSLTLKNAAGAIISCCEYGSSMFADPALSEGGYSLEQIDPFNPCSGNANWSQTWAGEGGTPGILNSVDAQNIRQPEIHQVIVRNDSTLDVYFNSHMNRMTLMDQTLYHVDNGMGSPLKAEPADSLYNSVWLVFTMKFNRETIYTLSITKPVRDCIGMEFSLHEEFEFGIPEMPVRNDVVINEVLFNPAGEGVDFVEVFNRSEHIFNLKTLKLADVNVDAFGAPDTVFKDIFSVDRLLMPGEYLVISPNPHIVREQYECGNPVRFIQMESFPSFNNEEGRVIMVSADGGLIDYMVYNEAMHHPLLNTKEGVSLERIHPDRSSLDITNWHSASSASGWATPALKNSQYADPGTTGLDVFIEPEVFSPDNDGYDDVVTIGYEFDAAGYMASLMIFDAEGRPVRLLVNNEMLGTSGRFSWDGFTEDRQKAPIGIYVVCFEAFDQHGRVKKKLGTVVLGGKMN